MSSQKPVNVLINGENTGFLPITDRGLNYGDGIFTTLSILEGVPVFLNRHLSRLQSDADRLGIPFPGHSILSAESRQLGLGHPGGILKITLTQGTGGRGYRRPALAQGTRILSAHPSPDYPANLMETGVSARFCNLRLSLNSRLAGIKHLNRLEQVLARAEWNDEGIREGLLLDQEGFLVEGVMSNLFLIRSGLLRTPLLDRCGVSGVMRGLVVDAAKDLGFPVEQTRILPEDAMQADEIFLTNSVIGLWPVSQLDGVSIPLGSMTRQLSRRVVEMAASDLAFQSKGPVE